MIKCSPINSGEPFSEERTRKVVDNFYRDGFAYIPGVLEPEEIEVLRKKADALLNDPVLAARENPDLSDKRYVQVSRHSESGEELPFILRNTIELDPIFRDMLIREPIFSLAEAIVGPDCKFCGQNVLRSQPGVAIEHWHVDGTVHFPVPEEGRTPRPADTPTCPMAYGSDGPERYRHYRSRPNAVRPGQPLFRPPSQQPGIS